MASFMELTARIEEPKTRAWEAEEAAALDEGGDALAIYVVKHDEGWCHLIVQSCPL